MSTNDRSLTFVFKMAALHERERQLLEKQELNTKALDYITGISEKDLTS